MQHLDAGNIEALLLLMGPQNTVAKHAHACILSAYNWWLHAE
jgi:hypothetical protein